MSEPHVSSDTSWMDDYPFLFSKEEEVNACLDEFVPPTPIPELTLTAPVAEKQPISAIRAEVCRVANELRKSAGMSKSMSMRTSWAMVKSGRAVFPVKGELLWEGT